MIEAGDLVIVTRSHCAGAAAEELGLIVTAITVDRLGDGEELICRQCKEIYGKGEVVAEVVKHGWHPTAWLKKIPPLTEPETIDRDEEITA